MRFDKRLAVMLLVGVGLPVATLTLDKAAEAAETLRTGGVILVLAIVVWWLLDQLQRRELAYEARIAKIEVEAEARAASLLSDLRAAQAEASALRERRADDLSRTLLDYQRATGTIQRLRDALDELRASVDDLPGRLRS